MAENWMTLEDAGRSFGLTNEQLWDHIMGRAPGGKKLPVYRLGRGTELRLRYQDLLTLLEPVLDDQELADLEKEGARPRVSGRLF
jgi:hypothetical protein